MRAAAVIVACLAWPAATSAGDAWIDLTSQGKADHWVDGAEGWIQAADAAVSADKPRTLEAKPGTGVWISSLQGRADFRNLTSKQEFADHELHVEFLIVQRGNAGVKLHGLYEIQIADSHGEERPTAGDCGGIYPRAELKPRYHTIDDGIPPLVNAARPAGQWQVLEIVFRAPRFDAQGNKVENARFEKVLLNGQLIHEDVELQWPTGHAWRKEPEVPAGPVFLQGDHGPVAYRNVRVRALSSE